jgi:hypothetical protein
MGAMTEREYALAEIAAQISDRLERYIVAEQLAAQCKLENPKFDRIRFMNHMALYAK